MRIIGYIILLVLISCNLPEERQREYRNVVKSEPIIEYSDYFAFSTLNKWSEEVDEFITVTYEAPNVLRIRKIIFRDDGIYFEGTVFGDIYAVSFGDKTLKMSESKYWRTVPIKWKFGKVVLPVTAYSSSGGATTKTFKFIVDRNRIPNCVGGGGCYSSTDVTYK